MIPGQEIAARIISRDPDSKPVTLLSRSMSAGVDSYTSYAWMAAGRPTSKNSMQSPVSGANETTTFLMLREDQTVEPKKSDRLTVEGVTWNIQSVTDIAWERYGFTVYCVADQV